jgi:hypothetical protein
MGCRCFRGRSGHLTGSNRSDGIRQIKAMDRSPQNASMTDDFPADIRRFIEQNIESLAELEMLLLVHSDKDRL